MKNWEFYLSIGIYIASQKIPILTVVKVRLKSAMNYDEGFIEIILRLSRLIAYNEIMLKLRKRFPKWPTLLKMESGRLFS